MISLALRLARHTAGAVQARRARSPLVDLVQDGRVVLGVGDAVGHQLLLSLGKAGDLAPAAHLRGLVGPGGACARQARRARGRGGGRGREEPGFRGLELLCAVVVIGEEGAGGLDVAPPASWSSKPTRSSSPLRRSSSISLRSASAPSAILAASAISPSSSAIRASRSASAAS